MSRAAEPRWRLWLPLLLGAAALAFLGDKSPVDAGVSATTTAGAQTPPAANAPVSSLADRSAFKAGPVPQALPMDLPIDRARLYPPAQPRQPRDLFAVVSWLPAPPAPAPAPSRPAETGPVPPSLTVLGKKHEAQQWEVYLAHGNRTLIAREGAAIDEGWRVERIAPPTMTLTMVATGQTMTIDVGEAR